MQLFPEQRGDEQFLGVYRRFAQQLRRDGVELILTTAASPFEDGVAVADQQRLLGSDLWGLGLDETRRAYEAINAAVRQAAAAENGYSSSIWRQNSGPTQDTFETRCTSLPPAPKRPPELSPTR